MSLLRYGEIFDKSWGQIKDRLPLVMGLSLVYFLAAGVMSRMPGLGFMAGGPIHAGYLICLLKIRDKNEMGFADFFWAFMDFNRFLQLLLFMLLYGFMIVGGLILLVIPGIYLAVALSLASTYFVTRKQDAIEALRASMRLVANHWWSMAGLLFMICLLNLAGVICLGIGLLVSAPMSILIVLEALNVLEKNQPAAVAVGTATATTEKTDF